MGEINKCTPEMIQAYTRHFNDSSTFDVNYEDGSVLQVPAEKSLPYLLPAEFYDQICSYEDDYGTTYYVSDAAWGAIQINLTDKSRQKMSSPLGLLKGESGHAVQPLEDPLLAALGKSDKHVPLAVENGLLEVTDDEVEQMLKNPPPKIAKKYDTEEWIAVGEHMTAKLVAQLRAAMGDNENELFRGGKIEGSHFVTGNEENLRRLIDILDSVKANQQSNNEETDSVWRLTQSFEKIYGEIKMQRDTLKDLIILCGVGFGIFSPLGNRSVDFLLHGSKKLFDLIRNNGKGPKGPGSGVGGGGEPVKSPESMENQGQELPLENMFDGTPFEAATRIAFHNLHSQMAKMEKRLRAVTKALDNGLEIKKADWQYFENFLNGYVKNPLIAESERGEWINKYSYEAGPESCDIRVLSRPENLGGWEQSISPTTAIGFFGSLLLGANILAGLTLPAASEIIAPAAAAAF